MKRLMLRLAALWTGVRQLSGDDAYERYLVHHAACHPGTPPLSRKEHFRKTQAARWNGIRRCC